MRNEAEMRELLADLDLIMEWDLDEGPSVANAFLHGFASGIAESLGLGLSAEKCGNPACKLDHRKIRDEFIARQRQKAAMIRSRRTQARTS